MRGVVQKGVWSRTRGAVQKEERCRRRSGAEGVRFRKRVWCKGGAVQMGVWCKMGCLQTGGDAERCAVQKEGAVQKGVRCRRSGCGAEGDAVQKVHAFLCLSG